MPKPKPKPKPKPSSTPQNRPQRQRATRDTQPGTRALADGLELRSYDIGALPLLKQILERMQLERLLCEHLPKDDPRTELPTASALLVLIANLLLSREPVYGVGEWAARFPPELLGLTPKDLPRLHDDRLGRSLDRMFDGIGPTLVMAVRSSTSPSASCTTIPPPSPSTAPMTRRAWNPSNGDGRPWGLPGDTARRGVPISSNCSTI